jgi:hypothetical protein
MAQPQGFPWGCGAYKLTILLVYSHSSVGVMKYSRYEMMHSAISYRSSHKLHLSLALPPFYRSLPGIHKALS